ncbi:hypothetical protein J3R82DRAFT_7157 [Butyriboletus roseoflavus]|nr:hypothetical protein J3R82DRAFT_7157 [Butyriboletus roseoflavus]
MQPNSHSPTYHCNLIPVTSLNTSRYDRSTSIQLCPQVINRGPTSRGSSVQSPRRFVHPEGQPYFVFDEFDFVVATEANVEDERTTGRILDCVKAVTKELQSHSIKVPPRCELFLELGDNDMTCNYYFVDHVGKALFWLEDIGTEMLDIPAVMSSSHLETALERLYWVHVELFPMHHDSHEQEFSRTVDDLYNVIAHGQADRLTSKTSTFPYTADACRQLLELLSRRRGQRMDGYTLCYAARLAGAITNQRFVTFYGQSSAQLDRLQEMFPTDVVVVEHKWVSTVADLVMWGIPRRYNNLMQDLYVNEQVYADQWTRFVSICSADWTNSLSWSFLVLIATILLANVHGGTVFTSIPSFLSCAISIASASCLHLGHQPLAESSPVVGVRGFPCLGLSTLTALQARYLRSAKWNNLGFWPSAVAFSLPRVGYLWAVGLLTAQIIFIASQTLSRIVALFFSCTIAEIFILMFYVLHPEEASITSLCRSFVCLLWMPAKPSHWSRDTPIPPPLLASRTASNRSEFGLGGF